MPDERLTDQPSIEDLTPLLRINKLCERFQKAWKGGDAPRIEDYLSQISDGAQESLLRNLLPIDIEARRRKTDESPSSDEYIKRFPKHTRLIRQAFFESTMGSFGQDVSTPSLTVTEPFIPVSRRLGDYVLGTELGRGGFGVVYEARHEKRGNRVALKTLPLESESPKLRTPATEERKRRTADRLIRFKREFRLLADINHPNLVGLHSLESDGDQWFFTMDLVEGTDFIDYVRPEGVLDEDRLRHALTQLVTGVMALHSRNKIHRDLKPSNVMVSNDGQLKILDFGLVAGLEAQAHTASVAGFVGTLVYAAPEQFDGKHSAASDWYSIGTMLFEALTGLRPFKGSPIEIMSKKQQLDPPSIASDDAFPKDLAELAEQLLARDINHRPSPLEIAQVVSATHSTVAVSPNSSNTELVGRDEQLDRLDAKLKRLRHTSQAQTVFIQGRSGEGKTSLVEHFLSRLREVGDFAVLAGRCYDRESVPFKALDGVIDALCENLQRKPGEDVALLLPDDMAFLVQLFPVFQRVDVISRADLPSVDGMDRVQVQHRGFKALKKLLTRLSKRSPIIMFADDLQWGDTESAEALYKILGDGESPVLMFIGTYRIDETDQSRFLQRWDELQKEVGEPIDVESIGVTSLSVEECTRLMIDRLGRDDELTRQRAMEFAEKTGGNPYLLIELIGCFDPETNSFEALSLPEVIERKLSRLNNTARDILRVVAVTGKAIGLNEAFQAVEQEAIDAGTISHMRSENLLRVIGIGEEERVDTYHDKIRETVLDQLPEDELRKTHRQLAQTIEHALGIDAHSVPELLESNHDGDHSEELNIRASDIAIHWEGAGQKERAMAFALIAAESARRQYAFDLAVDLFELAKTNSVKPDETILYRIDEGFARALIQMGRYEEALPLLEKTAELTSDELLKSEAEQSISEIYQRRGDFEKSLAILNRIRKRLGIKGERTRLGYVWRILIISIRIRILSVTKATHPKQPTPRDLLAFRTLMIVALIDVWMNSLRDYCTKLEVAEYASRFDHPMMQSFATGLRNVNITMLGNYGKAIPKLIEFQQKLLVSSDLSLCAQVTRAIGWLQIWNGKLTEATRTLEEAESYSLDNVPDLYSVNISRCWKSYAFVQLGELDKASSESQEVFDFSVRTGHKRFAGFSLENWTRATAGRLPFEELRSCFGDVNEDTTLSVQLLCAEALYRSRLGTSEESLSAAESALSLVRRNLLLNNFSTLAISTFVKAAREHATTISSGNPRESRRLLRRALRVGWWGPRVAYFTETHHAAMHRETAEVWRLKNRPKRALKLARRAMDIAERQGARYELAQARLLVAKLSKDLDRADADRLLSEAKEGMEKFEQKIDVYLAKLDRESTGQDIQESLDEEPQ